MWFAWFMGILMVVALIWKYSYQHGTSSNYDKNSILQKDATIIDISHSSTGRTTSNGTIHTTVYFSDGFSYLCHEYKYKPGLFGATLSIDEDTLNSIISNATAAHKEAYRQQRKRLGYADDIDEPDPYKPNPQKFICTSCGSYSAGWNQTCPKCGAVGSVVKTTDYLQKEAEKRRNEEIAKKEEQARQTPKFVCKKCGKLSTGWYQTCPKCGAAGKMEKIRSEAPIIKPQKKQKSEADNAISSKIDPGLAEQLRQLKSLLDDGIITQEEFDAKKRQLLGL